jgi:hypothetical protein
MLFHRPFFVLRAIIPLSTVFQLKRLAKHYGNIFKYFPLSVLGSKVSCTL